jgi:predicted ABC-type ATPase
MILSFKKFSLNEELSKNDPIPELNRYSDKLAIILVGTPGAGKSTFIKNQIIPKNRNIKSFSSDDVSLLYTKDPNRYQIGSSELNISRILTYIKTGQNFVYDTTGAQDRNVFNIVKNAKSIGYSVIFIHIFVELHTAIKQNIERDRQVDEDYLKFVYNRQYKNMVDYSNLLKPMNYYLVHNKEGKYVYYKYFNGKIYKRKVDKYVKL